MWPRSSRLPPWLALLLRATPRSLPCVAHRRHDRRLCLLLCFAAIICAAAAAVIGASACPELVLRPWLQGRMPNRHDLGRCRLCLPALLMIL